MSPVTASVRSACARTRGSSWVVSAAAPSPAPATSWRVATLRHISAGRQCSSARPGDDAPASRSRPRRRAARGRPSCAASSRPAVEVVTGGAEVEAGEVGQLGQVVARVGALQQLDAEVDDATLAEVVGQLDHQVAHVRLDVARRGQVDRGGHAGHDARHAPTDWATGNAHLARKVFRAKCAIHWSTSELSSRYGDPMTTPDVSTLLERARVWAAEDPDEETRAELDRIVADVADGGDPTDLADRFAGTLEFGTAGLRGALGAGPNRMNRVVVLRAAAGLAAYLLEQGATRGSSVVIGYDARHNSDVFARDTAEVMTGAGLKALVMPRPLPTPLLAFAIRELGCVAGVMVTASHNPPQDNGYKVYLGDGSQIVPPADAGIAAQIAAVGELADVPRGDARQGARATRSSTATSTPSPSSRPTGRATSTSSTPRCTASAARRCVQVLETAGFTPAAASSREQEHPDGTFPTVVVPEPRGAGRDGPRHGPRRAARRRPRGRQRPRRRPLRRGGPRPARLADAPRRRGRRAARLATCSRRGKQGVYATTIVSSSLLGQDGRGGRPAVRRDAHRLQVDRPGRRPGVRLRGGARLLRRPRAREGQGRRLGAAAALRAGRRRPRPRAARSTTCSTTSPPSTGCTPPTSCRSG